MCFVLGGSNYIVPLEPTRRWNLDFNAATAAVDYLAGLEQPGHWNRGVGGGILFRTATWKIVLEYAYGIDAIRSGGRGANSIGILLQLDWGHAKGELFNPS